MRFFPWRFVRADSSPPSYKSMPQSPTSTPVSDKSSALPLSPTNTPVSSKTPASTMPPQPLRRAKPPPNHHTVVSEHQNYYTGTATFVAMEDQTTEHRDRPVVIPNAQYFIDVDQHPHQGASICMLASYCDINAALLKDNDEHTVARLRQYMEKIKVATTMIKEKNRECWTRGASVDEEHFKYWYICHVITCLSAKSLKVTQGSNVYTGTLVKATLDRDLCKMILSGISDGKILFRLESNLGEVDNWHAQVEILET